MKYVSTTPAGCLTVSPIQSCTWLSLRHSHSLIHSNQWRTLLEAQGHPFKTPPFGFRPLSDSCLSMLLFGLDAHLHNEIWWARGATSPSALPLNTHKRKSTQITHVSISWLIGSRPAVTTTQLKLVSTNYCQPQVQHLSTNSHTKV